jgi:hypothetical protein
MSKIAINQLADYMIPILVEIPLFVKDLPHPAANVMILVIAV